MNKIIKSFIIMVVGSLAVACNKQLDINTDPNSPTPEQGTPKTVFPVVLASAAGRIGGDLAILGGIWSQYWTQNTTSNQYKAEDAYDLKRSDYTGTWDELWAGALNDAHYVKTKARENQDWNYFLMATVMKAYTMQVMVDLYDEIPYTEAFQGLANLQPKFDDGYTVYEGLLAELDSALSMDFELPSNTPADNAEFIFAETADVPWSIEPWIKFANTLKLKMYLRMVYAKPEEAEAGIRAMYDAEAQFLDVDAQMTGFSNAPDKSNPLYEFNFRKLNTDANLKASRTFLVWLQENEDPRIPAYFQPQTGSQTVYSGINQGDFLNPNTSFNVASKPNITATDPVDFISLAESNFLQAEALERYYGGVGAKDKYEEGVNASFERYGLDATELLAGEYAYPSGDFESKLEAIIVQKWASMPNSHALEAFFEKNRTGYPKTSPVYSTDDAWIPGQFVYPKNAVTGGVFAARLILPDTEVSKNANAPSDGTLTDKVWWDVN